MITGIILASGFSKRMKEDKLLLELDGERIIERVIRACSDSNLDDVILIYRTNEVKEIGNKYKIKTIYNHNAHLGQSEAMKLGIRDAVGANSYMFLVGDQPFITKDLINKLIQEYYLNSLPILAPYYNGHRGMPIIFSSKFKEELLNVVGDKGGRDIVKNNTSQVMKIFIEEEILGIDVDTQEDLSFCRNSTK